MIVVAWELHLDYWIRFMFDKVIFPCALYGKDHEITNDFYRLWLIIDLDGCSHSAITSYLKDCDLDKCPKEDGSNFCTKEVTTVGGYIAY